MTSIHVVPDRQQYIGLRQAHMSYWIDNSMIDTHQVHLANVSMIYGEIIKPLQTNIRRLPDNPTSALTISILCNIFIKLNNHAGDHAGSHDTLY